MRERFPPRGGSTDEPTRGKRGRARANGDNQEEADGLLAMGPSDQRVTKLVRLLEGEPEDRSDKPRSRPGDEREQRERQ